MGEALITAAGAGVRFGPDHVWAVRNVNVQLHGNSTLGIVGESGSGKTTIARALVGAIEPTEGSVVIEGRPWKDISRRDIRRRHVQMVFQDPIGSLNPSLSPRDTVAEVFQVWEQIDRREARARAAELLERVGLEGGLIDRRPRALSGGQCQRVGVARALACEPRVLIADEPTSSLDVSVQAQILNLLIDLRAERAMALVLVSHDLSVVRHMTDEVVVMHQGEVVERGSTAKLLSAPQHAYTKLLVNASTPTRRHEDPRHGPSGVPKGSEQPGQRRDESPGGRTTGSGRVAR